MSTGQNRRFDVASDFHISAGGLDDCDPDLEDAICAFVGDLSADPTATELVLNGDFLDFVQAPPSEGRDLESESVDGLPLCFSELQSLTKFQAIRAAHPGVFRTLGAFLGSNAENAITILPGNHDADFFWNDVQIAFREAAGISGLKAGERLQFHFDQVYQPPLAPGLWIEHGHQHDAVNRFVTKEGLCWSAQEPPIRKDRHGTPRLIECIGTRFLMRFINRLDSCYHFVDNVKPLSRFFNTFGASILRPGYGPLKALISVAAMMRYMARQAIEYREDLMSLPDDSGKTVADAVREAILELPEEAQDAILAGVENSGFESNVPVGMLLDQVEEIDRLLDFAIENPELINSSFTLTDETIGDTPTGLLSLDELEDDGTLALGRSLFVNETDTLKRAAGELIREGRATAVVMGHTHELVNPLAKFAYVNTGAWTRYYPLDGNEALPYWGILKEPYNTFPFRLCYAEFSPARKDMKLITYRSTL